MSFDSRIGILSLILGLVGLTLQWLWPEKKWIACIALVLAACFGIWWVSLESRINGFGLKTAVIVGSVIGGLIGYGFWHLQRDNVLKPNRAYVSLDSISKSSRVRTADKNTVFIADFTFANSGSLPATNVYSAYMIFVVDDYSERTQKGVVEGFRRDWPQIRSLIKTNTINNPVAISAGASHVLTVEGKVQTSEDEAKVRNGQKHVLVVVASRYQDRDDIYEFRACRRLIEPFDGSKWESFGLSESTIEIKPSPIPIQISFDLAHSHLPIVLSPGRSRAVISVDDTMSAVLLSVPSQAEVRFPNINTGEKWEQLIDLMRITNHGTVPALNITAELAVVLKHQGAFITEEQRKQMFESPTVAGRSLPISIEVLEPGESATFYIVNQSKYVLMFPLRITGTLEVPGQQEKFECDFKLRRISPVDHHIRFTAASPICLG